MWRVWIAINDVDLYEENGACISGIWSCLVGCEAGRTIRYRYLICEELDGRNGTVLTAWEAGMPRVLQLSEGVLII